MFFSQAVILRLLDEGAGLPKDYWLTFLSCGMVIELSQTKDAGNARINNVGLGILSHWSYLGVWDIRNS